VDGVDRGTRELPLATLFRHLPVAVLAAKHESAARPTRKRVEA
jgi:hypothetical protein